MFGKNGEVGPRKGVREVGDSVVGLIMAIVRILIRQL